MQTAFSRDLVDQNRSIEEVAAERPGKPIRVRIQPTILRGGQYQTWRDVRWTLECDSPSEAYATRDALRAFFQALARQSPEEVTTALNALAATPDEALEPSTQEVA